MNNDNIGTKKSYTGIANKIGNITSKNYDPSQIGKREYKPTSEGLKADVGSNNVATKNFDPSQIGKREYKPTSEGLKADVGSNNVATKNYDPSQIGKREYKTTSEGLRTDVVSENVATKNYDPSQMAKEEYITKFKELRTDAGSNNVATKNFNTSQILKSGHSTTYENLNNTIGTESSTSGETMEKVGISTSVLGNLNSTNTSTSIGNITSLFGEPKVGTTSNLYNYTPNNSTEITDKDIENFIDYYTRTLNGENIPITEEEARKYLAIAEVFQENNINLAPQTNVSNNAFNGLSANTKIEITDKDVDNYVDFVKRCNNGEKPSITELDSLKYMIIGNIFEGNDVSSIPNVKINNSEIKKIESYSVIEITENDVNNYIDFMKNPSEEKLKQLTDEQQNKYSLMQEMLNGNVEVFQYVKISDANLRKLQETYKKLTEPKQESAPQKSTYTASSVAAPAPSTSSGSNKKFGIDPDKIGQITKKINYYAKNEETYIMDILTALETLQRAYNGSATKDALSEKIQFIRLLLYVLLENRRKYVQGLNGAVSSYMDQNSYFMKGFNEMTPKLY